jgi:DNA-binding LacI/PurR family transcriptional regulator
MQKRKKITAKDIATKVGVSRQAVSAVLSGSNPNCVIPATREKIIVTAKRFGYRPDTAALMLAGHHTKQIGLMLPGYGFGLGFPEILVDEIRGLGYRALMMIINKDDEKQNALSELQSGAFDGIFIGVPGEWKQSDFQVTPLIFEYGECDLATDFVAAGRIATEHLIQNRYDNLIFCDLIRIPSADGKYSGACKQAGRKIPRLSVQNTTDFEGELLKLIREKRTGIICSDDILATQIERAFIRKNILIPDSVGIVGYGGYQYGQFLNPTLTTVAFPTRKLAVTAAKMLVDKIKSNEHKLCGEVIRIAPKLQVGGSTVAGQSTAFSLNETLKQYGNRPDQADLCNKK